MEEKIIELIRNCNELPLTAFKKGIPEISGEYDFHFPAKGIKETNILIIAKVNEAFILAMKNLIDRGILSFEPCDFSVVAFDGGESYDLPLVKSRKTQYKKLHWLPLLMKKGPQFR